MRRVVLLVATVVVMVVVVVDVVPVVVVVVVAVVVLVAAVFVVHVGARSAAKVGVAHWSRIVTAVLAVAVAWALRLAAARPRTFRVGRSRSGQVTGRHHARDARGGSRGPCKGVVRKRWVPAAGSKW